MKNNVLYVEENMTGNIQYLRTDRAIQSALLSLLGKKSWFYRR